MECFCLVALVADIKPTGHLCQLLRHGGSVSANTVMGLHGGAPSWPIGEKRNVACPKKNVLDRMKKRTIRVYGFLTNQQGELLVALERFRDQPLVKYPGGGVEWAESHQTALKREFMEELALEIEVETCCYFNDFAVISAFDAEVQVQSFFYHVQAKDPHQLSALTTQEGWEIPEENGEVFHWVSAEALRPNRFTYAIEQAATRAWLDTTRNP